MKIKQVAFAAVMAIAGASAFAQTSTFVDNGGVHEAEEFGSNSFQLPITSVSDKYTFSLASAVASIESDVASVGRPALSGTVTLWSDKAVDTSIGSYSFSAGSGSFGALSAGDYFYTVDANGTRGGGYSLGSFITAVPEPETYALLLAGLGVMGFVVRRRQR